jgi:hypothetical protein
MAYNNTKTRNNNKNSESILFKRLTKLLSGPIVNKRSQFYRQEKRKDLDKYSFQSASGKEFQKSDYNPFEHIHSSMMKNHNRGERYAEFDQMEFCLHGDTKIAVPGGYKTLFELSQEYGLDKEFVVYSYDHSKSQMVPAIGKQARKTRTDHAWKVTFENGQEIIGTEDHRLMMRDGTYRTISQLKTGDAMMPFYRKDLMHGQEDDGTGYRWIYSMHKDEGRKSGWIAEHILIAEWIAGRRLLDNEVVHHKNFVKYDNTPDNLQIMDNDQHLRYHQGVLNEQRSKDGWWDSFSQKHSEWMKQNNPAERKDITFEKILNLCDTYGYNQSNICKMLDTDPQTIKRRLNLKGFTSFEVFAKTYNSDWKNSGQDNNGVKNPRYDHLLDFNMICSSYTKDMSSNQLADKLGTTYIKLANRIKANGFKNFTDFAENYANHKVASIEYYGFIELYDLTVDGYKNFATDSVVSHNTPEIASSIDIYADEMTTWSQLQKMLRIDCDNEEIKNILNNLYHNILNVEFNLFGWCRNMCKYGDFFLYMDIDEEIGIKNVVGLPAHEVERLEGEDPTNPNYVQYQWNTGGMTFENWQIAHFRILGNDRYSPYGTSVLEPARRIWRQLTLIEDAMMAYRIVRSPERRVFYIDVGNIDPNDVEQYMQKIVSTMKRNQVIDDKTGRVDLRYNPMSIEEDYFLPVRGATSNTKIESLPGGTYTGDIEDVKYLRDKLFSALKVPQSYLARGEGGDEDKTTLAQKDVRFARTIQRLQRSVVTELEKIGIIHLYVLGYRGDDLLGHKITLNNPSKIAELQELEHWKTKFDVAGAATENFFSKRWLSKNLFGMSEEDFLRNQRELFYDRKISTMLDREAENVEEGAGGGAGGDLAGFAPPEGDDMASETPPEGEEEAGLETTAGEGETPPEGGTEAPEGEAGPLLVTPPARRDDSAVKTVKFEANDGSTTTAASKGKRYNPEQYDKRTGRKQHMHSMGNTNLASNTARNIFKGYADLKALTKIPFEEGIEQQSSIYNKQEEKLILENDKRFKDLITELEKKDASKKQSKT